MSTPEQDPNAQPSAPTSPAVGVLVAVDSFDPYAGKDVTALYTVVGTHPAPEGDTLGPRLVLALVGQLDQLPVVLASAVRVL
jgi:hypothetical protein